MKYLGILISIMLLFPRMYAQDTVVVSRDSIIVVKDSIIESDTLMRLQLNSPKDEFSAVIKASQEELLILFTTDKKYREGEKSLDENRNLSSIWMAKYNKQDRSWTPPKPLQWYDDKRDFSVAGTSTGRNFLFLYEGGLLGGELFVIPFSDGEVKKKPYHLKLDQGSSWETTAFWDESNQQIFFASDREGGYGGLDLYVGDIEESKFKITNIRNLGPTINTAENEYGVVEINDDTIFIASSGQEPDQKDYDIYWSIYRDGAYQKPVKVPPPLPDKNDVGYSKYGFWISDQKGSYDIYQLQKNTTTLQIKDTIKILDTIINKRDTIPVQKDTIPVIITQQEFQDTIKEETIVVDIGEDPCFKILDEKTCREIDTIRQKIEEKAEIIWAMVQLVAYYQNSTFDIPIPDFAKLWGITKYPLITEIKPHGSNGLPLRCYLIDRKFEDKTDRLAIERGVVLRREFLKNYPAFDRFEHKPFVNVYCISKTTGQPIRYMIYFDDVNLKFTYTRY